MNNKKTILVTGGTGGQGGSVARALLKDNKFHVRILTRNPQSPKALLLQQAGAEIVKGDFNDRESLLAAMKDCYGVFGTTNYWEHFENEYSLGKNLVDAVHLSGIRHFVLHSLPGYRQLTDGRYAVPHYDMKAELEKYTRGLQLPATFVGTGFYYENFLNFFSLQKDNNGGYYFGFPQGDTPLATASVEDMGAIVAAVFNKPGDYMGRMLMVTGADNTCEEYAAILSGVLKKNIYYSYVPRNVYAAYDFRGAGELADMFEVQRLYIPNRKKDMDESYRIHPSMQPFKKWVENNKGQFIRHFNSLYEVGII